MTDQRQLADIYPSNSPPYMFPAWAGAIRWALGEPDVLATFRAETGNRWTPGRTGIDRMIDEAVGADRRFLVEFCKWFNENVWGDPFAGEP